MKKKAADDKSCPGGKILSGGKGRGKGYGYNPETKKGEGPRGIPVGMKKESTARFAAAFQDELSKLSSKPFQTAAQRLGKALGKKAPVK